jgi:hypothetical protein
MAVPGEINIPLIGLVIGLVVGMAVNEYLYPISKYTPMTPEFSFGKIFWAIGGGVGMVLGILVQYIWEKI